MAFFLIAHLSTTLNARWPLHPNTSFYFATAGIHTADLSIFFVPYYFLAVVAVFVHFATAVHWLISKNGNTLLGLQAGSTIIVIGIMVSLLIMASLTGMFFDIVIAQKYQVMFG